MKKFLTAKDVMFIAARVKAAVTTHTLPALAAIATHTKALLILTGRAFTQTL